jgi:hypothetical protein
VTIGEGEPAHPSANTTMTVGDHDGEGHRVVGGRLPTTTMKVSPAMNYRVHLHPCSREIVEAMGGGCLHLGRWFLAATMVAKFNPLDLLKGGDLREAACGGGWRG